ncbi:MAG: DUF2271 domain-containing protein [Treponema sp.]|jgi:hypothetical protein|nr:DUF2271 domain-containing protein [Treponema sp.]
MKKIVFALLVLCAAAALHAQTIEISFNYVKQGGFASNQFAVWIEDSGGNHVRTLYAARFTAQGGWKKREQSIPLWVKQSGLEGMNKSQVDAVSGPTPGSGTLSYVWDGKDQAGSALPQGEYRVFVEATLRGENRVLYSAAVRLGAPRRTSVEAQPRYFGGGVKERGMISHVEIKY